MQKWPEAKLRRFIDAWNDGVTIGALQERFQVHNPAAMAASLRKQGYAVEFRDPHKVKNHDV